jgi:hypothetical protein
LMVCGSSFDRLLVSRLLRLASKAAILPIAVHSAVAQQQLWIRQFGTNAPEELWASAPDGSGGVYACGNAYGSFGGPQIGRYDPWLARFDDSGNQLWIRQFGTNSHESAHAAAPDGSGGIYLGGWTFGSLGGPNAGGQDAWIAHYDSAGNQLWVRQLGTGGIDRLITAAPDGMGGVYAGGDTGGSLAGSQAGGGDAWLARYDAAGNQLWIRQVGTVLWDAVFASANDGTGGVFVAGPGAWLARFDGSGNQLWSQYLDGGFPQAAAPDGLGGVYLGGFTWDSLGGPNAGGTDAWLARYDGAGKNLWIKQLGTSKHDFAGGAALDSSGGVYMCGSTDGSLAGPTAGGTDAWLARYDGGGAQLWIVQLGTYDWDEGFSAAPDTLGGVYISGLTFGSLGGPKKGNGDPWVARYFPCGVGLNYCTAKTNSAGCLPAISATGFPSATLGSGFSVQTINLLDNKFGLYFYSKSGPNNVPFQGGTLCAQLPLVRTAVQNSGGMPPCGGRLLLDFNIYVASGKDPALVAGQQVWIQTWSRDSGFAPPNNTSLSDALNFILCP